MNTACSNPAYRVLVIGPRRGLINALRQQGIAFAVWQERQSLQLPDAQFLITAPLYNSLEKIKAEARHHLAGQVFSHVIAGTENAVLTATVTRRLVGARKSKNSTVSRCRDKLKMKQYLSPFKIPMTHFLRVSTELDVNKVFSLLGEPVVKKHRKSSGGKHISFIEDKQALHLDDSGLYLLEKYIDAPEASIESFVNNNKIQFTNITQYYQKGHINFVPSSLSNETINAMLAINQQVIESLKINWGITHLEVYLTAEGPLFGEIALRPPGGYIMNAIHYAYDFNPWEAFLAMELGQAFDFPTTAKHYCAVEVFHPGDGCVQSIIGEDILAQHPAIKEYRVKIKAGDDIGHRNGVGQDTGYMIHASDSPEQRLNLHLELKKTFVIALV